MVKKVPPFKPMETIKKEYAPMVVITSRIPVVTRDALTRIYRNNTAYESLSRVVQTALEEFVKRNGQSLA